MHWWQNKKLQKKYPWLLLLIALICIVYWLSPSGIPTREPAQRQGESPAAVQAQAQSAMAAASELLNSSAATALLASGEPSGGEPTVVGEAMVAWQVTAAPDQPVLPLPEAISIYEYVQLDMENPVFPDVGDRLAMPLPGAEAASVSVTRATPLPNGDYSWSGYLEGQGTDYPAVMTYGANSAFATITTPQGSYSLESINGQGWVYKNPAAAELSHPGVSDYMDIPEHHH